MWELWECKWYKRQPGRRKQCAVKAVATPKAHSHCIAISIGTGPGVGWYWAHKEADLRYKG